MVTVYELPSGTRVNSDEQKMNRFPVSRFSLFSKPVYADWNDDCKDDFFQGHDINYDDVLIPYVDGQFLQPFEMPDESDISFASSQFFVKR